MSSIVDELWQGYSEQGEQTVSITKKQAREGALHGAAHVWIWRKTIDSVEILLQRRAGDKATWANHLDISAAGHIDSGETPLEAATRETQEEIGLAISGHDLTLIGVHRADLQAQIGEQPIRENEFQFVYVYELQDENNEIMLMDGEVSATYWLPLSEFKQLIDGRSTDLIVPHGSTYFSLLLDSLVPNVVA